MLPYLKGPLNPAPSLRCDSALRKGEGVPMKVVSDGIQNGKILDKYGKRGAQKNKAGIATCSLPFTILDS